MSTGAEKFKNNSLLHTIATNSTANCTNLLTLYYNIFLIQAVSCACINVL